MSPALAAALSAVATSTGAATAPTPEVVHRYVVTIGFNESGNPAQRDLQHADDDAARFFELLAPSAHQAYLLTRFDRESLDNFATLIDRTRAPSKASLEDVMRTVRAGLARDAAAKIPTELYFFYAGHGDEEDGVGFVNLSDGKLRRPEFTSLVLESTGAGATHVIIDACKSYFMVSGRGPGGERKARLVPFGGPKRRDGVGYVLSTSNDSESHEWSALSGGIFSHEVRSALLGAADADEDGAIDYRELEAFVAVANAQVPFPKFRPNVFIRPPPGRARPVILDLRRQRGTWLVVDVGDAGRLSIHDHRGLRYADANKSPNGRLRMLLAEGLRYDIAWGDRQLALQPRGGVVRISDVPESTVQVAARNEGHRAFEHLFARPFTPQVVEGFELGIARLRPPKTRTIVERPKRSPTTLAMFVGGGALVTTSVVLGILAGAARADLDGASQVDRDGLVDRHNAMTLGAAGTAAVGIGAIIVGIVLYAAQGSADE